MALNKTFDKTLRSGLVIFTFLTLLLSSFALFLPSFANVAFACGSICTSGDVKSQECTSSSQRRYEKCSSDGTAWETITEQCGSGTSCVNAQCVATCSEGWLDNYRCSGDWKQREYKFVDCRKEWQNYEYCSYGCSGDQCEPRRETDCDMTVSISSLSDRCLDENVRTTITLTNHGDRGGYVDVEAYICESDKTDCIGMSCNGVSGDPRVYVSGHDTEEIECVRRAESLGYHLIKVVYSGCGADPTAYSNTFDVEDCYRYQRLVCAEKYTNVFRCFGSWRQQQYQTEDCSYRWKAIEYCPGECSNGACIPRITVVPVYEEITPSVLPSARTDGKPLLSLSEQYEFKDCEITKFDFDIINTGSSKTTYALRITGAASAWIYVPNSVTLAAQEKQNIQAYAKIPCGAEDADFTLTAVVKTAAGEQKESAESVIKVKGEGVLGQPIFSMPSGVEFWIGLLLLLLLVFLLVLIFLAKRLGLAFGLLGKRRKRCRDECPAERFKTEKEEK